MAESDQVLIGIKTDAAVSDARLEHLVCEGVDERPLLDYQAG